MRPVATFTFEIALGTNVARKKHKRKRSGCLMENCPLVLLLGEGGALGESLQQIYEICLVRSGQDFSGAAHTQVRLK